MKLRKLYFFIYSSCFARSTAAFFTVTMRVTKGAVLRSAACSSLRRAVPHPLRVCTQLTYRGCTGAKHEVVRTPNISRLLSLLNNPHIVHIYQYFISSIFSTAVLYLSLFCRYSCNVHRRQMLTFFYIYYILYILFILFSG